MGGPYDTETKVDLRIRVVLCAVLGLGLTHRRVQVVLSYRCRLAANRIDYCNHDCD